MAKVIRKLKWFENTARRAYWSVHIEAWLRSGVACHRYCRAHRLNWRTMQRWLNAFDTPLPTRRRVEKKPAKITYPRTPARCSRAFIAFWSMHVEALQLSGLNATEYANLHQLPVRKFRRLRRQYERTPPTQDWREIVHSGRRVAASSATNLRYELRYGRPSTAPLKANLRDELSTGLWITGAESPAAATSPAAHSDALRMRRQFTDAQKLAMVAELADPDITVASVARRHQVSTSMLFRWRDEFGLAPKHNPLLLTAQVVDRPRRGRRKQVAPLVLHDLLPKPEGMIAVELADGRRVFAPAGSDPDIIRQHIAEQESCS